MKKKLFYFGAVTALVLFAALPASAEKIEGKITAMNSQEGLLRVLPAGAALPVDLRIENYMRTAGLGELQKLDVGKDISVNAVKKDGGWELESVLKPPSPKKVLTAEEKKSEEMFLLVKGDTGNPGRKDEF